MQNLALEAQTSQLPSRTKILIILLFPSWVCSHDGDGGSYHPGPKQTRSSLTHAYLKLRSTNSTQDPKPLYHSNSDYSLRTLSRVWTCQPERCTFLFLLFRCPTRGIVGRANFLLILIILKPNKEPEALCVSPSQLMEPELDPTFLEFMVLLSPGTSTISFKLGGSQN